ncbi:MAG: hypothetical protein QM532_03810 [Cyanobium sp. MAG06]|nr:hypothetical protein [Cyanobium sp. MAG06]
MQRINLNSQYLHNNGLARIFDDTQKLSDKYEVVINQPTKINDLLIVIEHIDKELVNNIYKNNTIL